MAVEIGSGNMDTIVGQDVTLAVDLLALLGSHTHQRKVGGSATDVGHPHHLFLRYRGLEVQRMSSAMPCHSSL